MIKINYLSGKSTFSLNSKGYQIIRNSVFSPEFLIVVTQCWIFDDMIRGRFLELYVAQHHSLPNA